MKKRNIIIIVSVLLTIAIATLLFTLPRSIKMRTFADGELIDNDWKLEIEPITGEKTRVKVLLKNKNNQKELTLWKYLLYTSNKGIKGSLLKINNNSYFITQTDNEGSNDTFYFTITKITDIEATRANSDNFTWACSNPVLKKNQLVFYGDRLSGDMDCFLIGIRWPLLKKEVDKVVLE